MGRRVTVEATLLDEHERMSIAIELVRRGMRRIAVQLETDLSARGVQKLYREIHGATSKRGPIPSSRTILCNAEAQAHASLLLSVLKQLRGAPDEAGSRYPIRQLLRAYDLYLDRVKAEDAKRLLGVTDAWVMARDVSSGQIGWRYCESCGVDFVVLFDAMPRSQPRCPLCRLINHERRARESQGDGASAAHV